MKKKDILVLLLLQLNYKYVLQIFQTYAEKRKVIKQQHQQKTETNTHLSTSIKKLQLQKIIYQ